MTWCIRQKDDTVKAEKLCPAIWRALGIIAIAFSPWDVVVTSADDYDHGQKGVPDDIDPKTYHGKGKAADFRTKHVPPEIVSVKMAQAREVLGKDYDLILEDKGGPNEHGHVEWTAHGGV
jgi:hypothetical protein